MKIELMRVGITGHQKRSGIDWEWVKRAVEAEFSSFPTKVRGFSSLAEGADQIFADALLRTGGELWAVIPTPDYLKQFEGSAREHFLALLEKASHTIQVEPMGSDGESFFAAGKYVVDSVDVLIAIWDGKPAGGLGGTADVVAYARQNGKAVRHIDTTIQKIRDI